MINGLPGAPVFSPFAAPQKQQNNAAAEQRPAENQTENHAEQMMDVMDDMAMALSQFNRRQYGKEDHISQLPASEQKNSAEGAETKLDRSLSGLLLPGAQSVSFSIMCAIYFRIPVIMSWHCVPCCANCRFLRRKPPKLMQKLSSYSTENLHRKPAQDQYRTENPPVCTGNTTGLRAAENGIPQLYQLEIRHTVSVESVAGAVPEKRSEACCVMSVTRWCVIWRQHCPVAAITVSSGN